MDARHERETSIQRLSFVLLALAIAGSALGLGAVHTSVLALATATIGLAAMCGWARPALTLVRPAATVLALTALGLTAYTLLQTLPLPSAWLAAIAPHNAEVWARSLAPFHEPGPAWAPISLDPVATRIEVVRGITYLLTFLTSLRLVQTRAGTSKVAAALIATGVALALSTLAHSVLGLEKVFGVYAPTAPFDKHHVAPLMNANHLAAYLNIAFCLSLGAALARAPAISRVLPGACALLLFGTQFFVASRGAVLSMAVGAGLVGWIAWASRRYERPSSHGSMLVSLGIATAGAVLLALGASETARDELFASDASKLQLIARTLRMVPVYPLFGVGRGAFESTYPEFRVGTHHVVYTHPEDIVAQWSTEWGVPVCILGMAAIGWALRPGAVLVRARISSGAWAALVAVGIHNLVDFSSEVPGVVIALSACAAIVVAGSAGHAPRWFERWSMKTLAIPLGISGAAATLLAMGCLGRGLNDDRERLQALAIVHSTTAEQMREAARAAVGRHPAEPYLPFAVALRAAHKRDESMVPWVGHTLERAPVYAPAHFVLARSLVARSPSQARLEYRLAIEQAPNLAAWVLDEAPRLVGEYDDALELMPRGQGAADMLERIVATRASALPATAARLDALLLAMSPPLAAPRAREASAVLDDLRVGEAAPWCDGGSRGACVRHALDLAREVQRINPRGCEGFALEEEVSVEANGIFEPLTMLENASDNVVDRANCLRRLAALAKAEKADVVLDRALTKLFHASCSSEEECLANLRFVAEFEEARGHSRVALAAWKRSHEVAPGNVDVLATLARVAAHAGAHVESMQAYEELARTHPDNPQWASSAQLERDAVVRSSMPR